MSTTTATAVRAITPPPGYRVCARAHPTEGWHVFVPEQPDQDICKLCETSRHFNNSLRPTRTITCGMCNRTMTAQSASHKFCDDCKPKRQTQRKSEWRSKQRQCKICDNTFWPRTPAAKICHNDACKREGMRWNDVKRRAKAKRKEVV